MGDDHNENEKLPVFWERRVGEGVVQKVNLVRRVAGEVDQHAGYQHLDHALPRSDGVRGPPAAAVGVLSHLELSVQLLRAGVQPSSYDGVQNHLHHQRQEVEEQGFQVLEDHEVRVMLGPVPGEDDAAQGHGVVGHHGHHLVEEQGGHPARDRHRPDERDHHHDLLPRANYVRLYWKHNGDESKTEENK